MKQQKYIIGIDLGTSNSVIAYTDLTRGGADCSIQALPVPQVDQLGTVVEQPVLPSYLYVPTKTERKQGLLGEGYDSDADSIIGIFAQSQLVSVPGRVVSSAKSWLCHAGVDREAPILPWQSTDVADSQKISPLVASARYLEHLRYAWEQQVKDKDRSDLRRMVVTVPASFDEVSQQLTLKAAMMAGFPQARLLEEPQAALYCWLHDRGGIEALQAQLDSHGVAGSATVLVCDVGGGTTDLCLFKVATIQGRKLPLVTRIAVSDHILLGGDNIDLAIAHRLLEHFGRSYDDVRGKQWGSLVAQARSMKEALLTNDAKDSTQFYRAALVGAGSDLFGTATTASLDRVELTELILDGFYPYCSAEERPQLLREGLQEWGLPYAVDSAITRHLAEFLAGRTVDAVLFNGGSLVPSFLRDRLLEVISGWQKGYRPLALTNDEPALAVARGAVYFAWVLENEEEQIVSHYPRSIYLEVNIEGDRRSPSLICVLPKGAEAGTCLEVSNLDLELLVDQPVRFQPYTSGLRGDDTVGVVVPYQDGMFQPLPPVETTLRWRERYRKTSGGAIPVSFEAHLTETGMLELYCRAKDQVQPGGSPQRWKLEFNVRKQIARAEGQQRLDPGVSSDKIEHAAKDIGLFYGKRRGADNQRPVKSLARDLERILGKPKADWNVALLRLLWEPLSQGLTKRGRSVDHEIVWLNLAGHCLRPGYGAANDDLRIAEVWRTFELGLENSKNNMANTQWWILWRRIAGGLDRFQQEAVMKAVLLTLDRTATEHPEGIRLAASLERASIVDRSKLGRMLVKRMLLPGAKPPEHYFWALGRLGSREPLYANIHCVLPAAEVIWWYHKLQIIDWGNESFLRLNQVFSQAARLTGDPDRDLPQQELEAIYATMAAGGASSEQLKVLQTRHHLEESDRVVLFGEKLPAGLRIGSLN